MTKAEKSFGKILYCYAMLLICNLTEFCILDVEKYFSRTLNEDKNLSAGIAAIKTLLMVLEKSKCKYQYGYMLFFGIYRLGIATTNRNTFQPLCVRSWHRSRAAFNHSIGRESDANDLPPDHSRRIRQRAVLSFHHTGQIRWQNGGRMPGNYDPSRQHVSAEITGGPNGDC